MDTSGRIPWAMLGIAEDACFDDARRAFRLLAKRLHPDMGGDAAAFAELVAAFRETTSALTREHRAAAAPRQPTPYDWILTQAPAAPHVWAERSPSGAPAEPAPPTRSTAQARSATPVGRPTFAEVLAEQLACWPDAA